MAGMTFTEAAAVANKGFDEPRVFSELNSKLKEHDGSQFWFLVYYDTDGMPDALGSIVSVQREQEVQLSLFELILVSGDLEAICQALTFRMEQGIEL